MKGQTGKRIPDEMIARMYVDYCKPMSACAVGRIHGVSSNGVHAAFKRRGLATRPDPRLKSRRLPDGRIAPVVKLTPGEIDSLVSGATRLGVPQALRQEWRGWDTARRVAFIHRVRAKLALPGQRPTTPFSDNVLPFEYGTPEAVAIADRLNVGRTSQTARVKIDIRSQGVIWDGRLWFWNDKSGYEHGPWTKEHGRPLLHRVIWEAANGRPVPPHHVVKFLDDNKNNLAPDNLVLMYRGDTAVENKQAGVVRHERTTRFFKMTAAAAALAQA